MPESVEGLSETWVMYRFKAEIGRKYAKDIVARKPLRIIRTLDPSALELSHAMVSTASPDDFIQSGSHAHLIRSRSTTSGPTRLNTLSAHQPKLLFLEPLFASTSN